MALKRDLLLDTHIVVWLATDPDRLPIHILETISSASHRFVSHISALEIQIKHQKAPEKFGFSLSHYEASIKEFGLEQMPLTYDDIRNLDAMEFLHRDPFDRMLMAQANARDLRLVTQDEKIIKTALRFRSFQVLNS